MEYRSLPSSEACKKNKNKLQSGTPKKNWVGGANFKKGHFFGQKHTLTNADISVGESFYSSSSSFEGYPLQVRHKQDWGRGFILVLPQTAALPGSDAGSDVIKPASSFVIQNHQTSCSMWCPMYRTRC